MHLQDALELIMRISKYNDNQEYNWVPLTHKIDVTIKAKLKQLPNSYEQAPLLYCN